MSLVLSRKEGEIIRIGSDVTVTVVYIDRGKVRLGIDAPRSMPIWRDELLPPGTVSVPMAVPAPGSTDYPGLMPTINAICPVCRMSGYVLDPTDGKPGTRCPWMCRVPGGEPPRAA